MKEANKLPKARCIICQNAIMIEGGNVYCPKLIDLCGKESGAGGFIGKPDRCKFFEEKELNNG
jgi:hypothetical protein